MSLWRKLDTLFRAASHESLQRVVDANDITIFAQEIRDAEQAIHLSKRELACIIAEANRLTRYCQSLEQNIHLRESHASEALEKGEDSLALEVAEQIAEDENTLQEQRGRLATLNKQATNLKSQIKTAVRSIARYKGELQMAKANQSNERALRQLNGNFAGLRSQMSDMSESIDRIRSRQEHYADFDDALQTIESDLQGDDMDARLEKAGINTGKQDAQAVLERLRKQQAA